MIWSTPIKTIAQQHGPAAIALLARLMKTSKNEQARIAAAKELLDRGYGKATQPLANDPENPLTPLPDKIEIVIVDPKGQRVPLPPIEQRLGSLHN